MKITIRQMQVFDAVATLGTISAAAEYLGMSQSAASSALADLQIVLRRSLFEQARGRPLQITDEGRRLHPMVRSVLGEIAEIERSEADAPLTGQLVIGATAMIAETELPRLCMEFRRRHPGVTFRVEAATDGELFERLARFELATALIENFPAVDGVDLTLWKTDEMILVATPDHPLAHRTGLEIADLAGMDWCMRESHSSVTPRLRYMLHEQIGQFSIAFESTSNWAVRNAVIAGGGIGCLSRDLVSQDIAAGRLVQLTIRGFSFTRSLSLARPRDIWRSRLVSAFDAFILAHGQGESGGQESAGFR